MGFRIVLSSLFLCLVRARALFACLTLPVVLGLVMTWLLMSLVAGTAWLRPSFWILAMNGFIGYFPLLLIGVAILFLMAQSTFAVGWHRCVLRSEHPKTFELPKAELVMRYLALSLLLGFTYLIVAYFVSVFAGLLFQLFPLRSDGLIGMIVIGAVGALLTYVMLRLALILPAAAVEKEMTLHQSWEVTGSVTGAVAEVAVVLTMIATALDIIIGFLPLGWYGTAVGYGLSGLITTLLSITSLSLLYGALVEEQSLPV